MKMSKALVVAGLLSLSAGIAQASVVTAIPGGTVQNQPTTPIGYRSSGPDVFGAAPTITWTSTYGFSNFGYTGLYGLSTNGAWTGALGPYMGLNTTTGAMTLALSSPVSAIGGFLNYAPGNGTPTIAVYDGGNNLIESYALNFSTSGNDQGYFFGFSEATANISSFVLSNSYIVATDITTLSSAAVPEPASLALFGLGLAGLGFAARRRKRA